MDAAATSQPGTNRSARGWRVLALLALGWAVGLVVAPLDRLDPALHPVPSGVEAAYVDWLQGALNTHVAWMKTVWQVRMGLALGMAVASVQCFRAKYGAMIAMVPGWIGAWMATRWLLDVQVGHVVAASAGLDAAHSERVTAVIMGLGRSAGLAQYRVELFGVGVLLFAGAAALSLWRKRQPTPEAASDQRHDGEEGGLGDPGEAGGPEQGEAHGA